MDKMDRMDINIEVQNICIEKKKHRGIQRYTIELISALSQRATNNYTFSFFDYRKERNNKHYVQKYIGSYVDDKSIYECNKVNYKWIMRHEMNNNELSRFHDYNDYFGFKNDILHFPHSVWLPPVLKGKVIVTVHDVLPVLDSYRNQFAPSFVNEFERSGRSIVDNKYTVITDSYNTKIDFLEYFGGDEHNIHVVPLGCGTDTNFPDQNYDMIKKMGIRKPYLLYLGALDERKGIIDILDAFPGLELKDEIELVIAGEYNPDHMKSLQEKIKKCGKNVIMPGYISEEQKRVLMSCAEAFLFPSEYEGFGLPILEAMACGTPVITSNTSSLPEVGGDAAIYVNPHDSEALMNAIELLLKDEMLKRKCIDLGFERCRLFSWENVAKNTEKVYEIVGKQ